MTQFKSFWWVIHQTFANFDVLAIGVAGAAGASAPAGNFGPGPGGASAPAEIFGPGPGGAIAPAIMKSWLPTKIKKLPS